MIACFLSNISAKYYKNLSMLSRVIAKNVGDVFFETQCISRQTDGTLHWINCQSFAAWNISMRTDYWLSQNIFR